MPSTSKKKKKKQRESGAQTPQSTGSRQQPLTPIRSLAASLDDMSIGKPSPGRTQVADPVEFKEDIVLQVQDATLATSLEHVERNRIAMSVHDMRSLRCSAGDRVTLERVGTSHSYAVAPCWPSTRLQPGQVQLCSPLMEEFGGGRFDVLCKKVARFEVGSRLVSKAEQVWIQISPDPRENKTGPKKVDQQTKEYILSALAGRTLATGSSFVLPLTGKRRTMTVVHWEGKRHNLRNSFESSLGGIEKQGNTIIDHSIQQQASTIPDHSIQQQASSAAIDTQRHIESTKAASSQQDENEFDDAFEDASMQGILTGLSGLQVTARDQVAEREALKQRSCHYFQTSSSTLIHLKEFVESVTNVAESKTSKHAVGGLDKELEEICRVLKFALQPSKLLLLNNIKPPRGVLLYGPPGTGKTQLAKCAAERFGAELVVINGPEILSKFLGDAESKLEDVFRMASTKGNTVVFMDEIDALCPSRDDSADDAQKRVVATLLTLLDGLGDSGSSSVGNVAVIAATNRPNAIDDALRRPGRLDREIDIGVPNVDARSQILKIHLSKFNSNVPDDVLRDVVSNCHGFVGADLMALCKEAAWIGLKRVLTSNDEGTRSSLPELTASDLISARVLIKPSALREVVVDVPKVQWDDIGGQQNLKQQIKEAVEWPLQHPEAFQRMGVQPPQGILLYGPPGCSKTMLAKAIATESSMNFIAIKGPELFSKWVGESEKKVQEVFHKARASAPTVVFFDEIDAMTMKRSGSSGTGVSERVLSQLLVELDGVNNRKAVIVVAATNRPDIVDPALLRPGRLDRVLYVPPPDSDARAEILKIHTKQIPCAADVCLDELAMSSPGFSGAELEGVCREAAIFALQEDMSASFVHQRHFMAAMAKVTPQISQEMLSFYESFHC